MNIVKVIHNRFSLPPFIVNGLPKAGTHLLRKALEQFSGIRYAHRRVDPQAIPPVDLDRSPSFEMLLIGIDWPRPVPRAEVRRILLSLGPGQFAQAHACFSQEFATLLSDGGIKQALILRDPRDVVTSHADFVAQRESHFLYGFYRSLVESDRIMTSIVGMEPAVPGAPGLLNIYQRYLQVMPWLSHRITYTTYFERLVGPEGGGARESQIVELKNLAQHLGIHHDPRDLEQIADSLFGGTFTFRKGTIGGWQTRFTDEQKHVFKVLAGQLLVDLGYEENLDW